jgi:kinesin family protein 5
MTEVAIKVVARFRPINKREKEESKMRGWAESDLRPYQISDDGKSVLIDYGGRMPRQFTLDKFLEEQTQQTTAFQAIALPAVMDCLRGINGCVFAYGQTGSGKTFTMFGPECGIEEQEAMVECWV